MASKQDLVARALKRLRMDGPAQGLLCMPKDYVDLRQLHARVPDVRDHALMGEARLYRLRVAAIRGFGEDRRQLDLDALGQNWRPVKRLELELEDEVGEAVYYGIFGAVWGYRDVRPGDVLHLVARIEPKGHKRTLVNVERPPAHAIGRVWTRYAGIPGQISAETVELMVQGQVDNPEAYRTCSALLTGEVGERAEVALRLAAADEHFEDFEALLRGLHVPRTPDIGWAAQRAAGKLTAMGLQAAAMRHNKRALHPRAPLPLHEADIAGLAAIQPEELTAEQLRVAGEILSRMTGPAPLNGVLSGDVGTGKTLVYLLPAVAAARAGARVSIVVPTDLLANQIAAQIFRRFESFVRVERVVAGRAIRDSEAILVGTAGLLTQAKAAKYSPNLLIFDEQHKLDTSTKECLVRPWTHVLEVSATPIPRSIAAIEYGGKEVFNLRGCPVRKSFRNHVADESDRRAISRLMRDVVAAGGRVAIVYPRVESKPVEGPIDGWQALEPVAQGPESAMSVIDAARSLEAVFPGQVAAVHGRMSAGEIEHAIDEVKSGVKPVLVATTVIETGIDIPSMKLMIVRSAECFGVAQLAQLRGRLVRNGGVGDFVMMVEDLATLPADTFRRLDAVRSENDGYRLAERDLQIRGFGTLEGADQSGDAQGIFRLLKATPKELILNRLRDETDLSELEGADGAATPANREPADHEGPGPERMSQRSLFG